MVALIADRSSSSSAISSKEKIASDKFSRLSVFGGSTNEHRTHPLISGAMVPFSAALTRATVSLGPLKSFKIVTLIVSTLFCGMIKLSVPVKS